MSDTDPVVTEFIDEEGSGEGELARRIAAGAGAPRPCSSAQDTNGSQLEKREEGFHNQFGRLYLNTER